jgi:hypothetical protein
LLEEIPDPFLSEKILEIEELFDYEVCEENE